MQGFGDVPGGDGFIRVQIGNGAGHFENTVVGTGREAHSAHGHFQGSLAGVIQHAVLRIRREGIREL